MNDAHYKPTAAGGGNNSKEANNSRDTNSNRDH
jgi:hypothetical protein